MLFEGWDEPCSNVKEECCRKKQVPRPTSRKSLGQAGKSVWALFCEQWKAIEKFQVGSEVSFFLHQEIYLKSPNMDMHGSKRPCSYSRERILETVKIKRRREN